VRPRNTIGVAWCDTGLHQDGSSYEAGWQDQRRAGPAGHRTGRPTRAITWTARTAGSSRQSSSPACRTSGCLPRVARSTPRGISTAGGVPGGRMGGCGARGPRTAHDLWCSCPTTRAARCHADVFALNFSRAGARSPAVLTKLPAAGFRVPEGGPRHHARTWPVHKSGKIAAMGPFEMITERARPAGVRVFKWRPAGDGYTVFDLTERLRTRGWWWPGRHLPRGRSTTPR